MTDSLTPQDLKRLEVFLQPKKAKTKEELNKKIDSNKKFPKTLKDFLKKEFGKKLPKKEEREFAIKLLKIKKMELTPEKIISSYYWRTPKKGIKIPAIAIRDIKGRFITWSKKE